MILFEIYLFGSESFMFGKVAFMLLNPSWSTAQTHFFVWEELNGRLLLTSSLPITMLVCLYVTCIHAVKFKFYTMCNSFDQLRTGSNLSVKYLWENLLTVRFHNTHVTFSLTALCLS